jgi:putative inorganic carbon (HCO3(-)) transporter
MRRAEATPWILAAAALFFGAATAFGPAYGPLLSLLLLAGLVAFLLLMFLRTELLVPAIIATTPLEITKLWIPFFKAPTDWFGYEVSLLDAGRLAIGLALAVFAVRVALAGRLTWPRDRLVSLGAGLVAFAALSMLYTFDPVRGRNEVLRLGFNLALLVAVAVLLSSRRRLEGAVVTWVVVGMLLSVAAIAQVATGVALWNPQLQSGPLRRANVTFADPNTFGSFLNVGLAFCVAMLTVRRAGRWWWLLAMGLLLAGLVATFSRSGWLALALALAVWTVLFARSGRAAALLGAFAVGGLAVLVAVPSAIGRLQSLDSYENLSVRPELIRAGLIIFAEHPLGGLGVGSFQRAVATDYNWAYPYWWYVTASHTSLVTTAAELGIVGLTVVATILASALVAAYSLAKDRGLPSEARAIGRGLFLGVGMLVVAGQTTGALFEEPYVWIALGMLVALRRAALAEDGLAVSPNGLTGKLPAA